MLIPHIQSTIYIQLYSIAMSNKKYVDFIFSTTNIPQILDFLKDNPKLNITECKDEKKNNILHQTSFQNRLNIMKIYIQHMNKYYESEISNTNTQFKKSVKHFLAAWINQTNVQGFTPVHYASFKGNLEMIKFLEGLGASLMVQTKLGLNMIHLAAQGDRLNVMLYLYDVFDLNKVDSKKGTPLHWACYMGSQNIVNFLLAINYVQIDCFDQQEQTPLHLATLYGNTKIVKKLLIKGADRSLRNSKGEMAIDLAKENQFKNIIKMLSEDYSFFDHIRFYCNLKIQYKPTDRSISKTLIFILTLVFLVANSHFMIKFAFDIYFLAIPACYYLFFVILYLSLIQGPKKIQKKSDFKQLIPFLPICPECRIPKLDRSYHCDVCKTCIPQYDHHCPWINNCVGKRNIGRFVLFVILLLIGMLQIEAISILGLLRHEFLFGQFRFKQYEWVHYVFDFVLGINITIITIFFIPIAILLSVQINNLFLNQTTFERFSKSHPKKQPGQKINASVSSQNQMKQKLINTQKSEKSEKQEKDIGYSFKNCVIMCSDDHQ